MTTQIQLGLAQYDGRTFNPTNLNSTLPTGEQLVVRPSSKEAGAALRNCLPTGSPVTLAALAALMPNLRTAHFAVGQDGGISVVAAEADVDGFLVTLFSNAQNGGPEAVGRARQALLDLVQRMQQALP